MRADPQRVFDDQIDRLFLAAEATFGTSIVRLLEAYLTVRFDRLKNANWVSDLWTLNEIATRQRSNLEQPLGLL
jgi:hypothetical protein